MLGTLLALGSAASFALTSALLRRGVLTGSVLQAVIISVPLGGALFLVLAAATGMIGVLGEFEPGALALLACSGVLHFAIGRYCNFRATKAVGAILVGPIVEGGMVWTIGLAVLLLGETITPLALVGILLIALGPSVIMMGKSSVKATRAGFTPKYREGITFAVLSSLCFGSSPLLVRLAMPPGSGLDHGIVAGLVAYGAATIFVLPALLLARNRRDVAQIESGSAKWFALSGATIWLSQVARYMALAVAPVSLVTPLQRTSVIFRLVFARLINPHTEVFSRSALLASLMCFLGVALLALGSVG